MRNWLGQDITTGTLVYRGARRGDTSEYKIGRVLDDSKMRVHWLLSTGRGVTNRVNDNWEVVRDLKVSNMDSKGNPSLDSLVVLPQDVNDRVEDALSAIEQWKQGQITGEALKSTLETLDFA